jgi:hypothetical protein
MDVVRELSRNGLFGMQQTEGKQASKLQSGHVLFCFQKNKSL